jgi:hypothetical protein
MAVAAAGGASILGPLMKAVANLAFGWLVMRSTEGVHFYGPADSPSGTKEMQTQVRIWVGMTKDLHDSYVVNVGGQTSSITLWGERGELLANKAANENIPEGNMRDFLIEPYKNNNRRAGYNSLTARK